MSLARQGPAGSARPLIIIGGGEHARVVAEAARSCAGVWELLGFVDRGECAETTRRLELRRLGDDDTPNHFPDAWWVMGIGSSGTSGGRTAILERYEQSGVRWGTVVHHRAWVSPTAVLGPGSVVMAGAVVNTGARIGPHCIVNTGAVIEHDVTLEERAIIAPGVVIGGGATVGPESYLGLGCRVRDHVRIGKQALVGMGAVVVSAVADGQQVAGVPARPMR